MDISPQNQENKRKSPPRERTPLSPSSVWQKIWEALYSFSALEKKIFLALTGVFIISAIGLLWYANKAFLVDVPDYGGSFTEGVVGTPRFVNPLLAISDADRDVTQLVYSGLMRATPEGELTPDLAEKYTISEDGLTYTFSLRDNLVFHDGEPVTSDDILFTITKIQDSVLKSPKRASWEGITVRAPDEKTVVFMLERAYAPFLENTTLGVLPKHIWKDISSEQFGFSKFNSDPIGSGPYKVISIKKDSSGIPAYYDLASFKKFALGRPYINDIRIRFYANGEELLDALDRGKIESVSAIPAEKAWELREKGARVERYLLPRVFGIFFNQNQNTVFTNQTVRQALNIAIDREGIIKDVLFGFANSIYGPIPPGALGYSEEMAPELHETETGTTTTPLQEAVALLERGGWELDEETNIRTRETKKETSRLQFSIATSDVEELKNAAARVKETWEQLGAEIDLKIFNASDLNQNVIRPRKYDALFFGEIIGRESDPFAFWHSSQRNDPGLNIALYANISADKLLEEGRVTFDKEERVKLYRQFVEEVKKDVPAVFVYSPDFIYILPEHILGVETGTITVSSERFLDVHKWFIETDRVWKIFVRE